MRLLVSPREFNARDMPSQGELPGPEWVVGTGFSGPVSSEGAIPWGIAIASGLSGACRGGHNARAYVIGRSLLFLPCRGCFVFFFARRDSSMRGLAYAIAAVAAVGIMVAIASRPASDADSAGPASADVSTISGQTMGEAGTLTLAVPEMSCSFSCFPRVKETLEGSEMVQSVELAPQKEEGVLDDRKVIVHYMPGFNVADALNKLGKEGFTGSEVVQ